MSIINCCLFATLFVILVSNAYSQRSFVIDYDNNQFLKDGQPYRYISGSMHYFRVPNEYWEDRLTKMKAAGLNAVQTYVAWNVHQPTEDQYVFDQNADLFRYLQLAQNLSLDVILRMGPYICAEWEFGGFPWWLLKVPNIGLRTSDPRFLAFVKQWYDKLLPMLQPYLYKNGGPVISMQIENEYGSRSLCDQNYTTFLRDLFRSYVGDDFVLFTTDGGALGYLKCGYIPGVYPTVDFGPTNQQGVTDAFAAQRAYAPQGPLVNSEFYPGWLDLWGDNHSTVDTQSIISSMGYMYQMGASFNFYMFEGGSNFGYMNGASSSNQPDTESYDYDAPLSEAGDPTSKYFAIQSQITNLTGITPSIPVPPATQKTAVGDVPFLFLGQIVDLLDVLCLPQSRHVSKYPKTVEQIDFGYGYALYETWLDVDGSATLSVPGINDRGYVMVDGVVQGSVSIWTKRDIQIQSVGGGKLQILAENMGRQNMGPRDPKGIVGNVTLNNNILGNWTIYPLTFEYLFGQIQNPVLRHKLRLIGKQGKASNTKYSPSVYYSKFPASVIADTFFNPLNWTKGQFFLNGNNVGRYWPALGPQVTLYVPKTMLASVNYALLVEVEEPGNCVDSTNITCKVCFVDTPYIDKPVVPPKSIAKLRNTAKFKRDCETCNVW